MPSRWPLVAIGIVLALAEGAAASHTIVITAPAQSAELDYGESYTFTSTTTAGCTAGAITWDFGDGTTGTGGSMSHDYAVSALGARTVTVTQSFAGTSNHCTKGNGPTRSMSIEVSVVDGIPPTIDASDDLVMEGTSAAGADVAFDPPASHDEIDGDGVSACDASSGTFPIGETTVTCSASDAAGNVAADEVFTVTVQDTTPPTIDAVADVLAEATSDAGAEVTFDPAATHDAVDGDGVAVCDPPSGTFPVGETTVTCSATDAAGNAAADEAFTVAVEDSTPPTIDPVADLVAEATSDAGADVAFDAPATHDAVDGDGAATCDASSGTFPIGETTVTCAATDAVGNAAVGESFTITVTEPLAPPVDDPAPPAEEPAPPEGSDATPDEEGAADPPASSEEPIRWASPARARIGAAPAPGPDHLKKPGTFGPTGSDSAPPPVPVPPESPAPSAFGVAVGVALVDVNATSGRILGALPASPPPSRVALDAGADGVVLAAAASLLWATGRPRRREVR